MKLHVALPNNSRRATPQNLAALAEAAEEAGFEGAWTLDHILVPEEHARTYGHILEALSVMAYLAARTSRIRLGVSVIVVPMRNPFVLARQVATLDALSGGRFTLGVGVGWIEEEFANVGADFRTRGARTDEFLLLLRHLLAGRREPFQGRFHGYEDGVFEPPPPQGTALPILVGGNSDAALRRAARFGDMWQGTSLTTETFGALVPRLRALPGGERLDAGARALVEGSPEEMREVVAGWIEAGSDHLLINFGRDPDAAPDLLRTFAREVAPNLAGAELA